MEPSALDLIAISQAIIAAHQKSDERQERLLMELPKMLVSQQHYDVRHNELERRITNLEASMDRIEDKAEHLPDIILQKIDTRQDVSRGHQIALWIAVANGMIAVAMAVFNAMHH
jgi:hypothetical protein